MNTLWLIPKVLHIGGTLCAAAVCFELIVKPLYEGFVYGRWE